MRFVEENQLIYLVFILKQGYPVVSRILLSHVNAVRTGFTVHSGAGMSAQSNAPSRSPFTTIGLRGFQALSRSGEMCILKTHLSRMAVALRALLPAVGQPAAGSLPSGRCLLRSAATGGSHRRHRQHSSRR
jgi:hypothetical protein